MAEEWYYWGGDDHVGPLSRSELAQLVHDGELDADDLVWCAEFSDWQQVSAVSDRLLGKPVEPAAKLVGKPTTEIAQEAKQPRERSASQPVFSGRTEPQYGGFWVRVLAYIIDVILTGAAFTLVASLAFGGLARGAISDGRNLLSLVVNWLYFAGFQSSEWQATPGKRLLGLVVTDLEGNQLSFSQASIRFFSKILSALILLIGFIMVGFTERKQGLHDLIARTLVIRHQHAGETRRRPQ
jgi:uncharacterized RDD family membrane protein YckC